MAFVRVRQQSLQKKFIATAVAIVLCLALLMGGAFAWTDFSQYFINRFRGGANNDALLHDDFDPEQGKKDIYVENTGDTQIVVRVRLDEFLQIGNNVIVPATGGKVNDRVSYVPHLWHSDDINRCELVTHKYFAWNISGAQKTYLHGTSEFGYEDYNSRAVETDSDLGANGQQFGQTAPAFVPVMMADYLVASSSYPASGVWVLDPEDGWAYWSVVLAPGAATNLLLNGVSKTVTMPDDNWTYHINAILQASNKTEVERLIAKGASADGAALLRSIVAAAG